jgi:hypothetical protein
MDERFTKALVRKRESKYVDFKESFDPTSPGDWCEVIKDIVAIGNSGGGVIVFGLLSNGAPSGKTVRAVAALDPAIIGDKVYSYTHQHLPDFQIVDGQKNGHAVVGLLIPANPIPVVFEQVGTYPVDGGRQKTAFSKGTVYFRHGAKSEPGTAEDLRESIERRLEAVRKEWLAGVKKVVSAPAGSQVAMVPSSVVQSADPSAFPIRLSDDPDAPVYRVVDVDDQYPYRQKELIAELNARRPNLHANSFDILSVRRTHNIEGDLRYCHTGRFSSAQYSEAFVDWLVDQLTADPDFIVKARAQYQKARGGSSV